MLKKQSMHFLPSQNSNKKATFFSQKSNMYRLQSIRRSLIFRAPLALALIPDFSERRSRSRSLKIFRAALPLALAKNMSAALPSAPPKNENNNQFSGFFAEKHSGMFFNVGYLVWQKVACSMETVFNVNFFLDS